VETFGNRVRRLRKERHWTLEDLEDVSGVSARYIGNIERNVVPVQAISVGIVEKLAHAFNMHPAKLLYPDYP
jgi:transcriptional regulator with XRE-family HTH domain